MSTMIEYNISPTVGREELNALFAASWPHHVPSDSRPVLERSLAYLCAYHVERLIGFKQPGLGRRHSCLSAGYDRPS